MILLIFHVQAQSNLLVTPQWVSDHLKDPNLVIVQVNFLKQDYLKEHIEGAHFLWPAWLAPDSPEGSYNAPDVKEVNALFKQWGINDKSQVVVCFYKSDLSVAARMFLTLENFGLKGRVLWLDGGLDGWKKAGYAISNVEPPARRGTFKAKDNALLVDNKYVQQAMQSSTQVVVDARLQKFYDGEPSGLPRDGHIPGAKNIPYADMVDATQNVFKPVDQLQQYFVPIASKDKELISYCFIGQSASIVYLAGRLLGYNMKVYDGSMQEWSRIESLPMEVTKK